MLNEVKHLAKSLAESTEGSFAWLRMTLSQWVFVSMVNSYTIALSYFIHVSLCQMLSSGPRLW